MKKLFAFLLLLASSPAFAGQNANPSNASPITAASPTFTGTLSGVAATWTGTDTAANLVATGSSNVGIAAPIGSSTLNVYGGMAVGTSYLNIAPPANGAIIQGTLYVGRTSGSYTLQTNGTAGFGGNVYVINGNLLTTANQALNFYPGNGGLLGMTLGTTGILMIGTTTPVASTLLTVAGSINQSTEKSCATGLTTDSSGTINGCVASDPSIKKDIHALTPNVSIIDALQPITYYWVDPSIYDDKEHYGFNAKQVFDVAPQLTKSAGNGLLGIDNSAMDAEIILDLQSIHKQLDDLREAKGLPPHRCNVFCKMRMFWEGL